MSPSLEIGWTTWSAF